MNRIMQLFPAAAGFGFVQGQVDYIRERGFEVELVATSGPELEFWSDQLGVPSWGVDMSRQVSPWSDARSITHLTRLFRERKPCIVHANTVKGGLLGLTAARAAGVPVRVYHQHGFSALGQSRWQDLEIGLTERVNCRLASRVLCVSDSVRDSAIEKGWWSADKSIVLKGGSANGIDADCTFNPERVSGSAKWNFKDRYGIPENARVIGFVGRIVNFKGVPVIAEAWRKIRNEYPDVILLLVGGPDEIDPIPDLVYRELADDPRVVMTGSIEEPNVAYASMDLLLLPSEREGFPTVLLEASAMGLPIVASRTWGCVDVVDDNVTGSLIPLHDTEALMRAIGKYLDSAELRHRHGQAGRDKVLGEYRQEIIWEAVYQEYCRLLREKGLSVPGPSDSSIS